MILYLKVQILEWKMEWSCLLEMIWEISTTKAINNSLTDVFNCSYLLTSEYSFGFNASNRFSSPLYYLLQ